MYSDRKTKQNRRCVQEIRTSRRLITAFTHGVRVIERYKNDKRTVSADVSPESSPIELRLDTSFARVMNLRLSRAEFKRATGLVSPLEFLIRTRRSPSALCARAVLSNDRRVTDLFFTSWFSRAIHTTRNIRSDQTRSSLCRLWSRNNNITDVLRCAPYI